MKYRDEVPLTEREFAVIRAEVVRRVTRRQSFAWMWAVAAIVVVVSLRPLIEPSPAIAPRAPEVRRVAVAATQPAPPATVQRAIAARPRHHHPKPKLAKPHAIELLTANPDIRIIWITDRRNS